MTGSPQSVRGRDHVRQPLQRLHLDGRAGECRDRHRIGAKPQRLLHAEERCALSAAPAQAGCAAVHAQDQTQPGQFRGKARRHAVGSQHRIGAARRNFGNRRRWLLQPRARPIDQPVIHRHNQRPPVMLKNLSKSSGRHKFVVLSS
jgi:hypothetical protein